MNRSFPREESIFTDALAQPEALRCAFLDKVCDGDPDLRAHLEALLAAHASPSRLLPPGASGPGFAAAAEEQPGDLIGRYKLLQKLGEGGCGVVWLAEQAEPVRRRVALKVIKLGMDTKAVVTRFEAERQALAMMEHPNIAKVFDAGSTDTGRPFFVMEWVRGIPVTKYCDDNHLTPVERLELFITICLAVQHAHRKGIIHRDLKPSNILVTSTDGVATPKVIDFGIAKATQGRLTDSTLFTAFELFIGTPAYMSPEQAQMSSADIDARSDIYSLGVLLYELMTGQPPFDPRAFAQIGVDAIRQHIRETEPPTPSQRLRTLGEADRLSIARLRNTAPAQLSILLRGDLDWIVMRCLEKSRLRRYESAEALALDIRRHLQHQPVTARPPGAGYQLQKFVRRHRVGFGAVVMCTAALLAGIAVSQWASRPSTTSTTSIAVLAFKNLSDDRENESFSEGVSEELLNVLAKVPSLHVAGPRAAFYFKGKDVPQSEIAQKLRVAYLVDGSTQRVDDRVRINVRLINAATGYQVWSDASEYDLKNIFAAQDEIAREIAENLQLKLGSTSRAAKTVNPEGHRLVLQGRQYWNQRNQEGFTRAEEAFENAIALDPKFAEAHAGLAEVCVTRSSYREFDGHTDNIEDIRRAKAEAQIAMTLDAALAEPHAVLGFAARLEQRLEEAERHFRRALVLNPNSAVIHNWYALLLACRGKLDASIAAYARASALDPGWFINVHRHAWHLTRAGRWSEALEMNAQAAPLYRGVHIPNRADRAVTLLALGLEREAVEAARFVIQQADREPRWQADSDVVWVLRRTGHHAEALEHGRRVLEKLPADNFNRGFVLAAMGRFEEALPLLERAPAVAMRGLYWDAMWDEWRDDERFRALLTRLGRLKDYDVARAALARMTRPARPAAARQKPVVGKRE